MKKTVLTLLASSVLFTSLPLYTVQAAEIEEVKTELPEVTNYIENNNVEEITDDDFLNTIQDYIYKSEDGTVQIRNLPIDIEGTYANEINSLVEYLNPLNEQVLNGEMIVTEDFNFISTENSGGFSTFASSPKKATIYWWGYQYVFNNAQGKQFANSMEDLAGNTLTAGGMASFFGVKQIGAALMLLGAPYYKQLAKKVRSKNTSKGVIVNITHASVFTVKSR